MLFFDRPREYFRPWKVTTFVLAIALLIAGSIYAPALDWDTPITLIMGLATYLTAPWSMRVLLKRQWRYWPAMGLSTWFAVDGSYAIYWHFKDPSVLEMRRDANFAASLPLYGMAGIFWLYRGSLREFRAELHRLFRQTTSSAK